MMKGEAGAGLGIGGLDAKGDEVDLEEVEKGKKKRVGELADWASQMLDRCVTIDQNQDSLTKKQKSCSSLLTSLSLMATVNRHQRAVHPLAK